MYWVEYNGLFPVAEWKNFPLKKFLTREGLLN